MNLVTRNILKLAGAAAAMTLGALSAKIVCERIAKVEERAKNEQNEEDETEFCFVNMNEPHVSVDKMDLESIDALSERLEDIREACDSRREQLQASLEKLAKEKAKEEGKELFVVDDTAKMFHRPRCVNDNSIEMRREITTREELEAKGYTACSSCFPDKK